MKLSKILKSDAGQRIKKRLEERGMCILADTNMCRVHRDTHKTCLKCESEKGCRYLAELTAVAYTAAMASRMMPESAVKDFVKSQVSNLMDGNGIFEVLKEMMGEAEDV